MTLKSLEKDRDRRKGYRTIGTRIVADDGKTRKTTIIGLILINAVHKSDSF